MLPGHDTPLSPPPPGASTTTQLIDEAQQAEEKRHQRVVAELRLALAREQEARADLEARLDSTSGSLRQLADRDAQSLAQQRDANETLRAEVRRTACPRL